ncbi:MAG TPA: glycosyltransferase family 39 protein [Candidatus Angelobacter sp.]|nr:glycosyltransferase family 39 protein [Candidatus Angelobacter sp.]
MRSPVPTPVVNYYLMTSTAQAAQATETDRLPKLYVGLIALMGAIKLLLHLLTNSQYGYFRDELYYLDCARHLDWGYADHAPGVALYAKIGLLFGGSLQAIRFLPTLAGVGVVITAMLIARELGGKMFAQFLAGFCTLLAMAYLLIDSFLSMNAFEPLFWMACILVLLKIMRTGNSRLWLWFGLFAGLGLENKHSTAFFCLAVLIALVLTPLRRELTRPWIWLGVSVAVLIFLPNIVWQIRHNFATLELLRNVQKIGKNVVLGPGEYFLHQVLFMSPLSILVWGAALVWLFLPVGRRFRVLGWIYLALLALFIAMKGKDYYLYPIYPMLFAAGAVAWEQWTQQRDWLRPPLVILLSTAALLVPLGLPILPPGRLLTYMQRIHLMPPKSEVGHRGSLPQYFGDRFGWEELVDQVAHDYNTLPPDVRAKTAIFANNYGEAGAIDLFGPKLGLPTAISTHQNYFFWGPPPPDQGAQGSNLLVLGDNPKSLARLCDSVQMLSFHYHAWGMGEENGPILLCTGLKSSLQQEWPRLKKWN